MSDGPRDFDQYVFMRRAADEIGRRINGANWTGDEFEAALIPQVLGILRPNEGYARALLAEHLPGRKLPPRPRLPEPIGAPNRRREIRLSELTPDQRKPIRAAEKPGLSFEDFQAADEIALRLNERAAKAIERRKSLFDRLVSDAEAGRLIVSTFDERGDLPDMPAGWWRSSFAHEWLSAFQMEPGRPFGHPSRSVPWLLYPGFAWLYVRCDRLAVYIGSIAAYNRPDWWPRDTERTAPWFHRREVRAELARRLAGTENRTKRDIAKVLAVMAGEGGKPWKWESIEVTLGKNPWPTGGK